MHYVYRLRSRSLPHFSYTGFTSDLRRRLQAHNGGSVRSTAPFAPLDLVFYAAFRDQQTARDFEAYLKTGSGHAFAKRRLW